MATPRSFTKMLHTRPYSFIDPTERPGVLSCANKTVIVTGAASGSLGCDVALAFAKARAAHIGLIGRTESTLNETKSKINKDFPDVKVVVAVADVSVAESIGRAAHEIRAECGAWDVFVHSAAALETISLMRGADEDDWWHTFEVNVRSLHFIARHFLTKCRNNATFINVSAASAYSSSILQKTSAYSASKAAAARLCDFVAAENESIGLRVFDVHPGVYRTPMFTKFTAGVAPGVGASFETDDPVLAANFFVWCASPEADFLKGRHLWAKWDVEELMTRKAEIQDNPNILKLSLNCGQ